MSKPSPQERELYHTLRETAHGIADLQQETAHAIGAIARQGYKAIRKLPAKGPYIPVNQQAQFRRPSDFRYFAPWQDEHDIEIPAGIVSAHTQEDITRIGTITTVPRHLYGSGFWVSLPARKKEVIVATSLPPEQQDKGKSLHEITYRISTAGDAVQDGRYTGEKQLSNKTIANPADSHYRYYHDKYPGYHAIHHYSDPQELLHDHAERNSKRLHVAAHVCGNVRAALAIDFDEAPLLSLTADWEHVDQQSQLKKTQNP